MDRDLAVSSQYDAVIWLGLLKLTNRTVVGIASSETIAYYRRGTPSTDDILAAMAPAPR